MQLQAVVYTIKPSTHLVVLALSNELNKAGIIEVDVGERGEDSTIDKAVDLSILDAVKARMMSKAAGKNSTNCSTCQLYFVHTGVAKERHVSRACLQQVKMDSKLEAICRTNVRVVYGCNFTLKLVFSMNILPEYSLTSPDP